MNEIQSGRFNGILHKLLDMKDAAPAPTLAPEVISTLCLEADRPEWAFLGGERLGMARAFQAASVGANSVAALSVPASAGILVVLEQIWIANDAGAVQGYTIRGNSSSASDTEEKLPRDSRLWDLASPPTSNRGLAAICDAGTAGAASGTTLAFVKVRTDETLILSPNLVIANTPGLDATGRAIQVWTVSQNVSLNVTFVWRERAIEAAERR